MSTSKLTIKTFRNYFRSYHLHNFMQNYPSHFTFGLVGRSLVLLVFVQLIFRFQHFVIRIFLVIVILDQHFLSFTFLSFAQPSKLQNYNFSLSQKFFVLSQKFFVLSHRFSIFSINLSSKQIIR